MVPWSPPATANNRPNSNKKVLTESKKLPPTMPPIVASSSVGLNGPDTPPVLFNPYADRGCSKQAFDDTEERCRNCHSTALVTDWAQGDRVCTSCGVVAESHLMDERPEWKDFNDAEDIIKGLPSKSRSGLVAVDETKYIGGLQPTILSKDAFGQNCGGWKMTKLRQQLKTTNKRLDHIMEKVHKRALQDAKLERRVRLKREADHKKAGGTRPRVRSRAFENDPAVRPEFDMIVLQEEEDENKLHAAIYADKWSLDRAIYLHGTGDEGNHLQMGESREDLLSSMDRTLRDASQDLYTSYSMITEAARSLRLPNRVMDESVHRLVRYVTRRDGFTVKGVSSRLPNRKGKETKEERKLAATRLREYNKMKQMSSLGAAILYFTSRTLGWARTIAEICDCFRPSLEGTSQTVSIKAKHCSCAMNEIKSYFPEYTRMPIGNASQSGLNESDSTSNFADHFVRNLQLPPVAEACIRTLLVHCKQEQKELGVNSGVKISTLCATIAYFVCTAGGAMQKKANQVKSDSLQTQKSASGADSIKKETKPSEDENEEDGDSDKEPFDVFSHAPIVENQPEKIEYEMRRMWDAWAEQMAWSRSLDEIEQSCSTSRTTILNLYKSSMHPRRESLLKVLQNAIDAEQADSDVSIRQTPMASILLAHISTAGGLMSSK